MAKTKKKITIDLEKNDILKLYGIKDENLKIIENRLNVNFVANNENIIIKGKKRDIVKAEKILLNLKEHLIEGKEISRVLIEEAIEKVKNGKNKKEKTYTVSSDNGIIELVVSSQRGPVKPKSYNQNKYINEIFNNQIVFGIGPAGTGKTYLAVAVGLYFLRERKVERIVLVRPAVEAGENLGFLPGDMKEKVDPYLRPIYDAAYDMIEPRVFHELLKNQIIEIAPLAYMRGRTLNKAFIVLDEAQNTTIDQMKMFLTRTGNDSKVVITGDITQIDLPVGKKSGLIHAKEILKDIEGISFVFFDREDVARASIVKKIIDAYEEHEKK